MCGQAVLLADQLDLLGMGAGIKQGDEISRVHNTRAARLILQ